MVNAARIEAAIRAAERRTSGEIRVSIAKPFWGDVRRAAERAFARLGMANTRDRNGVLIFVVPARHAFAVLGDAGIHAHVGQAFWDRLSAQLSTRFHAGDFTLGLEEAIAAVADALAAAFPFRADDVNELPDAVDRGA